MYDTVLAVLSGVRGALLPAAATALCAFVGLMLVGHYLAGRRVSKLQFRYDEEFDPLQYHKSEVVCVLDIKQCHWCYLLARDVWNNVLVRQHLDRLGLRLRLISPKRGVQFVRHQKLPHFSAFPCTVILDHDGNEVKRLYGLFSPEDLKASLRFAELSR